MTCIVKSIIGLEDKRDLTFLYRRGGKEEEVEEEEKMLQEQERILS